MTTRHLTGVYASGYAVAAGVTTLIVDAGARVYGSGVSAGAYLQIDNYGTIKASDKYGLDLLAGGSLTNAAVVEGARDGVNLQAGGAVVNGTPQNAAALISGTRYGVHARYGRATVSNFGTISGGAGGLLLTAGGLVTNGSDGATSATIAGGDYGIEVRYGPAAITNLGTIAGTYKGGVELKAGGSITNGGTASASASIMGYFNGVYASDRQAQITNFGAIDGEHFDGVQLTAGGVVANGAGSASGARITGYSSGIYASDKAATVTNFGTVAGGHFDGVALTAGGYVANGGTATARSLLTGYDAGVYASGRVATVINFGTIIGSRSAGIDLMDGGSIANVGATVARSLISGLVGVYAGPAGVATVNNFGTIEGTGGVAVDLRSAGDRLIAENGSVWIGAVQGGGGGLELASGTGAITGLGAGGRVSGAETLSFSGFGSYLLDAGSAWKLVGGNVLGGAQSLTTAASLDLAGALTGTGTFDVAGGVTTVAAAAVIGVRNWSETGGTISFGESLAYKGFFRQAAGASIVLASGERLTLSAAALLDGSITGAGSMLIGSGVVGGLSIGGTIDLGVTGAVSQGGVVTVGDAGGGAATLSLAKTAVWRLGAGSIDRGAATTSRIVDDGLLIKNAGVGTSTIATPIVDYGIVEAATGTLDLAQSLSGSGALRIDASARLQVDAAASGALTASFNGANATLAMTSPDSFAATIAGFAVSDVLDLKGLTATGASVGAGDKLNIVDGATTIASLQLAGSYAGATFTVGSDGAGGTDIRLAAAAGGGPHALVAAMVRLAAPAASTSGTSTAAEPSHPSLFSPRP